MSARMVILTCLLTVLLIGCGDPETTPGRARDAAAIIVDYPLAGSVFPPDFTMPTFLWHDASPDADRWRVVVTFEDDGEPLSVTVPGPPPPQGEIDPRAIGPTNEIYEGTEDQRSAHSWRPDASLWSELKRRSVEKPATVMFLGIRAEDPSTVLSRGKVTISTSADPVGAPIFYRDVPLMPSRGKDGTIKPLDSAFVDLIAWRLRDVSRTDTKLILTDVPSCANCHSFSNDGKTLGMDVDGPQGDKGAYALASIDKVTVIGEEEVITWNDFKDKPEGHRTFGFLSRISPDGTYALTTLNEALYVSNFTDHKFLQVFYPTRGILAWYSRETKEMEALPGADDTEYVHCDPVWLPDGEEIVFARAKAFDPYIPGRPRATYAGDPNEPEIRFDLYRMPFAGGKGGTPVPIEGASNNGMSNTFPKVSPDGKWIVYTKCKNGQLMRPDGRLWIVPLEGGGAREMKCNTRLMNSWHSFSPNSRWMVFSSKSRTPYTQMFLTHIDEDGNDTPAILIPGSTAANRAVNIPEFVNRPYESFDAIDIPAVDHHRHLQEGLKATDAGRLDEAVSLFGRALEKDPTFGRALLALGFALLELERFDEARERLAQAIEIDPNVPLSHVNMGLTYLRQGEPQKAAKHFETALALDPREGLAHHNMGLAFLAQGRHRAAVAAHAEAARFLPADATVRNSYGWSLQAAGRFEEAIAEYRAALEHEPNHVRARVNLMAVLRRQGEFAMAIEQAEALLEIVPDDVQLRMSIAWDRATRPEDELRDGARAVLLAEECLKALGERPDVLDVLAAAHAEAGRFDEAIKAAKKARELADAGGGPLAGGFEDRLSGYQAGRPYRQR